ncbi:acylphosphatase [Rhodocaloribacter sp.]
MPLSSHERLTARVYGRVQAVGYRHFVWTQARRLGLTGWVRNERDGSVAVVAEGPRPALESLLDALREGPPAARVERIETAWSPATGTLDDFEIRLR